MSAVTQGPSAAAGALTGLARALVQQGRLRPDRAEALARKATQSNTLFVDELAGIAETIGLSGNAIARFAAETFGHPLFDLAAIDVDQLPKDTIDKKLVTSLRVLALRKRGNRLAVGVSDPTNYQALDQIKFQTQLALDIIVVEHDKLVRLIEATTQSASQSLERLIDDDVSFEDLLADPQGVLGEAMKHVGLEFEPRQLETAPKINVVPAWESGVKQNVALELDASRAYAWKNTASPGCATRWRG